MLIGSQTQSSQYTEKDKVMIVSYSAEPSPYDEGLWLDARKLMFHPDNEEDELVQTPFQPDVPIIVHNEDNSGTTIYPTDSSGNLVPPSGDSTNDQYQHA